MNVEAAKEPQHQEDAQDQADGTMGQQTTVFIPQSPPPSYSRIDPSTQQTWTGRNDSFGSYQHSSDSEIPGVHTMSTAPPLTPNQPSVPYPHRPDAATQGVWTWMPGATYFPPGLEHLAPLEELLLHKNGRKYVISNIMEQPIFTAKIAESGCCTGNNEGHSMKVQNNASLDVLMLRKTTETETCCGPSTEHVEVSFPQGSLLGVVQGTQQEYTIHNPSGDMLLLLEKEASGCCVQGGYQVVSSERFVVGCLALERERCCCCCRSSKHLRLAFPSDLDLRTKALLLSGALSIYEQFYT
ncbi:unnamed protein product [Meganyctiphanes norvegica]|uniref:Phospholipid scramblase n=1 Tax=Meganyctiphanes norvegica TaxID=48144 RepID=A0AAV2R4C9_MEGNR